MYVMILSSCHTLEAGSWQILVLCAGTWPCVWAVSRSLAPPPCYPRFVIIASSMSPAVNVCFSLFDPLVFAVLCQFIALRAMSIPCKYLTLLKPQESLTMTASLALFVLVSCMLTEVLYRLLKRAKSCSDVAYLWPSSKQTNLFTIHDKRVSCEWPLVEGIIFKCIMQREFVGVFAVNFRVVTMDSKFVPFDQMVRPDVSLFWVFWP